MLHCWNVLETVRLWGNAEWKNAIFKITHKIGFIFISHYGTNTNLSLVI